MLHPCPLQLRVNQDEPMEEYLAHLEEPQAGAEDQTGLGLLLGPGLPCKEQMRTNVINEIMSTERDYIKHLKDICEVWWLKHRTTECIYLLFIVHHPLLKPFLHHGYR